MPNKAFLTHTELVSLMTAIGVVVISGAFTLIGALVTNWQSAKREERAYLRQQRTEHLIALRLLYENVLVLMAGLIERAGYGSEQTQEEANRLHARLALLSTPEITDQFVNTASAVQKWAVVWKKLHPNEPGRLQSQLPDEQIDPKAEDTAYSLMVAVERQQLLTLLVNHLATLDRSMVKVAQEYSKRADKTDTALVGALRERAKRMESTPKEHERKT